MSNKKYEAFKQEIEQVASDLGKLPTELSRKEFLENTTLFTEWDFRPYGGYTAIKTVIFGETNNPLIREIAENGVIQGIKQEKNKILKTHREIGNRAYEIESIKKVIQDAVGTVFDIPPSQRPASRLNLKPSGVKRTNIVHISDTHFGLNIDPAEVESNQYSWSIAARRLGKIADEAANYKLDHREECQELIINLGGDLGQGIIHLDDAGQELLVYQVLGCARYLIDFIEYQSRFYEKIRVAVTPDNHFRIVTANKGQSRTTAQKFDSYNTIMVEAVQQAFRNSPRIEFIIPKTPYTEYKVFGFNHFLTHGDTTINVGYFNNKIDLTPIKNQIMELNCNRTEANRIDVVWVGHVHTGVRLSLDIDVDLFVNPSLSGTDNYAVSIGKLGGSATKKVRAGQWIVECTEEQRIGDTRLVWAQQADDDSRYENIIRPFDYSLVAKKIF